MRKKTTLTPEILELKKKKKLLEEESLKLSKRMGDVEKDIVKEIGTLMLSSSLIAKQKWRFYRLSDDELVLISNSHSEEGEEMTDLLNVWGHSYDEIQEDILLSTCDEHLYLHISKPVKEAVAWLQKYSIKPDYSEIHKTIEENKKKIMEKEILLKLLGREVKEDVK